MTHAYIRELVGRDDAVILEIGANDGEDTLQFLSHFPRGLIYCFEPDPRAIVKWKRNVIDPRAQLFEFALDTQTGERVFYQSGGFKQADQTEWDKSGSLCKPTGHLTHEPRITFTETLRVPTRRLDDWSTEHRLDRVDFIWIDTQGYDGPILSASPATLAITRWVKIECHRKQLYAGQWTETRMLEFFCSEGWQCRGRYHDDLLFENTRLKV